MYFEVENTPERIKKSRCIKTEIKVVEDEIPVLTLAAFTKAPIVLFENIPVGVTAERILEVVNPTNKYLEVCLAKPLPVDVYLSTNNIKLSPQTKCHLTFYWRPIKTIASKESVTFSCGPRSRHDVALVLKSVSTKPVSRKTLQNKKTPKKIGILPPARKAKTPPNLALKRQIELQKINRNQVFIPSTYSPPQKAASIRCYDKENLSPTNARSICPFDSFKSIPDMSKSLIMDNIDIFGETQTPVKFDFSQRQNYLTERHGRSPLKSLDDPNTDLFDNINFTPMKTSSDVKKSCELSQLVSKDALNKSDDIDLSRNPFEINENEEATSKNMFPIHRERHEFYDQRFLRPPQFDTSYTVSGKTASSPIKFNGIDVSFTLNQTDISRDLTFAPTRNSTECKITAKDLTYDNKTIDLPDAEGAGSDTYTKSDSPVFLKPTRELSPKPFHSSFITKEVNKRLLHFNDHVLKNRNYKDRNSDIGVRSIIEAGLWNQDNIPPTPPYIPHRVLSTVDEESSNVNESHFLDKTDKQQLTFVINQTFDKIDKPSLPACTTWSRKSIKCEANLWKMPRKQSKFKEFNSLPPDMSSESHLMASNVYAQASTLDPFLSATYFYDEKAVDKFEKEFKAWLNYILTPPADLETNGETQPFDIGKAWVENRNKELPAAPTKEQVSSRYHDSRRLESLRKAAKNLLHSTEIQNVYSKVSAQIDKKIITIRQDRNLHLNIGLQKAILNLLLCYNPLWLRISFEAIYNSVIPLTSNSDICGLSSFIVQRMFKDPYLKSKNLNHNVLLPSYAQQMNKFTLKKFFLLVFFLDKAKEKKLIFHDPCLFSRNAQYKESKEILIAFTRELIAGIGDITRHLKPLGYIVTHKQSYLDEFKFGVNNIAVDLKDGVRLTKVMEVILVKPGLTVGLRTPAVSRLQKIHNVQMALEALKEANFNIVGDIAAKDIVDGHREKTLSLLWQIIHVFRAPLFEKAASVIQIWWRKIYFRIIIEKRIKEREEFRRHNAACVIQRRWRSILYERMCKMIMEERTKATITIQKYARMIIWRQRYLRMKKSVRFIENWYITAKQIRQAEEVLQALIARQRCATKIQNWFRRQIKKRNIEMIVRIYKAYIEKRRREISAANTIKRCMKSYIVHKKLINLVKQVIEIEKQRKHNELLNESATKVQSFIKMAIARAQYLKLKETAIKIQSIARGTASRKQLELYKKCIKYVQQRYRAKYLMKKQRDEYLKMKSAAVKVQAFFRAVQFRRKDRRIYISLRNASVVIQERYRALILMRRAQQSYISLKKAAMIIQIRYKANKLRDNHHSQFITLKNASLSLQRRYRARRAMINAKSNYQELKKACVIIQHRYRALISMRKACSAYIELRRAVKFIQERYRAKRARDTQYNCFHNLKKSTICIQRRYRARKAMLKARTNYVALKNASIVFQRQYRAQIQMRIHRNNYLVLKNAVIFIQTLYRANKMCYTQRSEYNCLRNAAIVLQRRYVAKILCEKSRYKFVALRHAAIVFQRRYRAQLDMRKCRNTYLNQKNAAKIIQERFRAYRIKNKLRNDYIRMKNASNTIKRWYRNLKMSNKCRSDYLEKVRASIVLQKHWRAKKSMNIARKNYLTLRRAVLVFQTRFRALQSMRKCRKSYLQQKQSAVKIQRWYRATKLAQKHKKYYCELRKATVAVQRKFRANIAMKYERENYESLKNACKVIQNRYRAQRCMRKCRKDYLNMKSSALKIQYWYRTTHLTLKLSSELSKIKCAVRYIQAKYRATVLAKKERNEYLKLKKAVVSIEEIYRGKLLTNKKREYFLTLRRSATMIQTQFRMRRCKKLYTKQKSSAIKIQRMYRATISMRQQRMKYVDTRNKVIKIQSVFRGYIQLKKYTILKACTVFLQRIYRAKKLLKTLKKEREHRIKMAIVIQRNVRKHLAVKRFSAYRTSAIKIQRIWRAVLLCREVRRKFTALKSGIANFQAHARGYLVRKDLPARRERKKLERDNFKATLIQRVWRGYLVRRHSSKELSRLKESLAEHAKSKCPSLAERNEEALFVMRNLSDMAEIISSFYTFSILTEVYPMIYKENADFVSTRVVLIMSASNRGAPSTKLIQYGVMSLVHLCRYEPTAYKIYNRDNIHTCLILFLRWCDKDSDLFCAMCTYLYLHAKYPTIFENLKQFLHMPENLKIMLTIRTKMQRKRKMELNCEKSKSCRGLDSKIPTKPSAHKRHILPAMEPHFGIEVKKKPSCFVDEIFAIDTLFNKFDLPAN